MIRPEVKICGLTRPADAALAAELGARYVGVILATGPRLLSADHAREVLGAAHGPARVAVVGGGTPESLAAAGLKTGADILQLHGDQEIDEIDRLRALWPGRLWVVIRIGPEGLPPDAAERASHADAVLLDARVEGRLGGTGQAFDWRVVTQDMAALRAKAPIVLAGGLTPDNISEALDVLTPHVVDVSSGVESAPGIKDAARMRAFMSVVTRWHPPSHA